MFELIKKVKTIKVEGKETKITEFYLFDTGNGQEYRIKHNSYTDKNGKTYSNFRELNALASLVGNNGQSR